MDGVKMPRDIPKGYAYGLPQIHSDSIFFRAGVETWEFPAFDVIGYRGIATSTGPYYIAKVSDLRKLQLEFQEEAKEHGLRRKR